MGVLSAKYGPYLWKISSFNLKINEPFSHNRFGQEVLLNRVKEGRLGGWGTVGPEGTDTAIMSKH